jgi:sn-1 stearoyl-lipid 9-desaturase
VRKDLTIKNINWVYSVSIGMLHVLAAFAFLPRNFSWTGLALCIFLFWLSIWIGIGVCYHRLLTHSGFETSRWFRYVLVLAACLSWEGGPIVWVGRHRIHHQNSDKPGDPHSPNDGFSWAHMFWVCFRAPLSENKEVWRVTGDLQKDPGLLLLNEYFWVPQVVFAFLLFWIGSMQSLQTAYSWVIWGIGVRTTLGYHITWFVNSACHTWGYRNYETSDRSTNLWWVALPSGGEGWHNNHHADARSAMHGGRRWYEVDLTYQTIRFICFLGLGKNIVLPKKRRQVSA